MRMLVICCITTLAVLPARAEVGAGEPARDTPARTEPARQLDFEWNAGLAVFGGIGGNVGLKLESVPHLRIALGAFSLQIPEFGLGENQDMGWAVRDRAILAEGRYYLRARGGGFYASTSALYQQRVLTRAGAPGSKLVHNYVVAPAVGYQWFPLARHGLYVTPSFTFAVRVGSTGAAELGGKRFVEKRYLPLPGIHLGWEILSRASSGDARAGSAGSGNPAAAAGDRDRLGRADAAGCHGV